MTRGMLWTTVLLGGLLADSGWAQESPVPTTPEFRRPSGLTAYDFMTDADEFYYHHLSKLCLGGDIAEWPLVRTLATLGADVVDSPALARAANHQINISEQPRARLISQMVDECADLLGVVPPPTYIDGNPVPNAYVTGLATPHMLVITSGLLELYQDTPDELRFVIGHELAHIRCQHLRTLLVARLVVFPIIVRSHAPTQTPLGGVVASVAGLTALGTLTHWFRAAEYSADRGALLCVGGRVDIAQQALARLLHQTRQSNKLMDAKQAAFDVKRLYRDQQDLRHRPLVQLLSFVDQFSASHPFLADRCVALEAWAQSEDYRRLMTRPELPKLRLAVTGITVRGIPPADLYIPGVDSGETDPLLSVTYAGTTHETERAADKTELQLQDLDFRFSWESGAGVIVDLYDYNTVLPNRLVGSVRLQINNMEPGEFTVEAPLQLDIESPSTVVDLPMVTLTYRLEYSEPKSFADSGPSDLK